MAYHICTYDTNHRNQYFRWVFIEGVSIEIDEAIREGINMTMFFIHDNGLFE